jgi:hypothetical protein
MITVSRIKLAAFHSGAEHRNEVNKNKRLHPFSFIRNKEAKAKIYHPLQDFLLGYFLFLPISHPYGMIS